MKTPSLESFDILDAPQGHAHDFWDDGDDLRDIKQLGNDWFCVGLTHFRLSLSVYSVPSFFSLFPLLTIVSTHEKSSIQLGLTPNKHFPYLQ